MRLGRRLDIVGLEHGERSGGYCVWINCMGEELMKGWDEVVHAGRMGRSERMKLQERGEGR